MTDNDPTQVKMAVAGSFDSEIEQAVNTLAADHPELAAPEKRRSMQDALRSEILRLEDKNLSKESRFADLFTSVATMSAGGFTVGLLAATLLPTIPELSVVAAIIGVVGSRFAATKLDQFAAARNDQLTAAKLDEITPTKSDQITEDKQ